MSFVDLFDLSPAKPTLNKPKSQHHVYVYIALVFVITALMAVKQGAVKLASEIDWIDVVGEGATLVASLAWLFFIVAWRPPGPVTRALALGFALLAFGFYLDALDEFVRFNNTWWGKSLESIVTPIALVILTLSAISLYGEQRVLRRQQSRREAHYRDHLAIDAITDLYNADYCKQVLESDIQSGQPPSVWMIDLEKFDAVNQDYGFAAGDAVLNRVANTLVASVPKDSLVCRYAGDRFVVLTRQREISLSLEKTLSQLLSSAMNLALFDYTGKEHQLTARAITVEANPDEAASDFLNRAHQMLRERASC